MSTELFFTHVTAVDCAYLLEDRIVGDSFSPQIVLKGPVETEENVIVDFSKAKKLIKDAIDGPFGPDHKLVVTTGLASKISVVSPNDAVVFLPSRDRDQEMACLIERVVNDHLEARGVNATIEVTGLDRTPVVARSDAAAPTFTYVHGLKKSSSYGCQNIAHGHLSFLQCVGPDQRRADEIAAEIASDLDGTMFVWNENWKSEGVEYSCERGDMRLSLPKDYGGKVYLLETETTVEHLAAFVVERYRARLEKSGVWFVYVSEGLIKGARALV